MIDLFLVAIVAVVTWCVASEGAWGSAFTLLGTIIAGLLAMSFFEPLAGFLQANFAGSVEWAHRWDIIALLGLFAGFMFAIRAATEKILPVDIVVHGLVYDVVRWMCGVATGYTTMAIILTALHTAPLPREFFGFLPERNNFLAITAPDRQWLGFTQYVTERAFRRGSSGPIFDGPVFAIVPGVAGELGIQNVWPSFPIRYASRRQLYASGGGSNPTISAPGSSAPPVPGRPARPGTSGF